MQITQAKITAVRNSFTRAAGTDPGGQELWMYQVDLDCEGKAGRTVWPFAHSAEEAGQRALTQIGEADLNDHHGWFVARCSRV